MSQAKSEDNYIFKCDKQLHRVAEKLVALAQGQKFCDTTLIAGADNTEVKTHRLVLYLSSEYFRTMFDSVSEDHVPDEVISINNIDGDTLKKVIGFMYTFEIEMSKASFEKVLSAATLFQMETLIEGCCDLIANEFTPSNCLRFVHLSAQHSYTCLYEKTLAYAYKNFEEVSDGEEYLKLTEPQLSKFLSHDGVNVISPETLFLSLIKWLKYDPESREESMYIILNDFVRFAQLDPKFILKNAASVAHIAKCAKLLFSWLDWHSSEETPKKQEKQEIVLAREIPKKQRKIILAYIATCNDKSNFTVRSLDPDKEWSTEDWPQPTKMGRKSEILITQNKCFIAGGKIGDNWTNSVECLDLESIKWRCLPPMLTERWSFGMTVLNENLYVVGGWNKTGLIRLVEKYDFTDGKWISMADLPVALDRVRAVSVGEKLYVSGVGINHLKCYDPATNKWSETPDKNEKSSDFRLAANEVYVYAVGGIINENATAVERYNPANNTWTLLESIGPRKCMVLACTTIDDKLLVSLEHHTGGSKYLAVYNDEAKKWSYGSLDLFSSSSVSFINHLSTIYQ